jgi:bis(5'-nucleosidyl)-tetraphosphatase
MIIIGKMKINNNIPDGAGIIVVKKFLTNYKVLGLFDHTQAKYDFPKGAIDPGESAFAAALRETEEECGITDLKFSWGMEPIPISHMTMYVAETTQEPYVEQNPRSGILEHLFGEWMDWDDLESVLIDFLVPALKKARYIVEK